MPEHDPKKRPFITKAPRPPEYQVRGNSSWANTAPEPANWKKWADMVTAELREAVALSLGFEPQTLRPSNVPGEFMTRLDIACNHAENDKLSTVCKNADAALSEVDLRRFAEWALSMGWEIPASFPRHAAGATTSPGATTAAGGSTISETDVTEPDISHTGAAGRPSIAHIVDAEFKRRSECGEAHPVLADEAHVLFEWKEKNFRRAPRLTEKTIKNRIRAAHREWRLKAQNTAQN